MIYQYNDIINFMGNKKYKIQMNNKIFKIMFYVTDNNKSFSLFLYNNLREVYKQETFFLTKNDNVLCHIDFTNKNNFCSLEDEEENNNINNSISDSRVNNDNNESYKNNNKRKLVKSSVQSAEK